MFLPIALLVQTLYFQTSSGNVYTAVNDVPAGACVLTGSEELVFEATNFNTCNEIMLSAGCYRAELRGGKGEQNKYCADYAAQDMILMKTALFSLSEQTTVYALRGGDGNPGGVVKKDSSSYGSFGGGASGVDTILVVGDRVWRAVGGAGKTCSISSGGVLNMATDGISRGNGLGGKSGLVANISQSRIFHISDTHAAGIAGGGGGAPNDLGASNSFTQEFPNDSIVVGSGKNGTSEAGGDGGDVTACVNLVCTKLDSAFGGKGGANVYYSCGGQTAVSYGGGGGGGAVTSAGISSADGGDGGSGSTGTSDVSFLRIYKM